MFKCRLTENRGQHVSTERRSRLLFYFTLRAKFKRFEIKRSRVGASFSLLRDKETCQLLVFRKSAWMEGSRSLIREAELTFLDVISQVVQHERECSTRFRLPSLSYVGQLLSLPSARVGTEKTNLVKLLQSQMTGVFPIVPSKSTAKKQSIVPLPCALHELISLSPPSTDQFNQPKHIFSWLSRLELIAAVAQNTPVQLSRGGRLV